MCGQFDLIFLVDLDYCMVWGNNLEICICLIYIWVVGSWQVSLLGWSVLSFKHAISEEGSLVSLFHPCRLKCDASYFFLVISFLVYICSPYCDSLKLSWSRPVWLMRWTAKKWLVFMIIFRKWEMLVYMLHSEIRTKWARLGFGCQKNSGYLMADKTLLQHTCKKSGLTHNLGIHTFNHNSAILNK